MLDTRKSGIRTGTIEATFRDRLDEEGIAYKFVDIKNVSETHRDAFMLGNKIVSFKPFSATILTSVRSNKFIPQVWDSVEVNQWQGLGLSKRLMLHK
jgi:hypothetical protein